MERRRRQDDGPWNRPNYGSTHSNQARDFYHEAYQQTALLPTRPYTDFSHGRTAGPPVPWDSRAHGDASQQQFGGSEQKLYEHGTMGPGTVHHGYSHSLGDREAQSAIFPHGSATVDGPQLGIPPHMTSTGQRVPQHGGLQSGIPPSMSSTEQNTSHYGGSRADINPSMVSTEQSISQHGGPHSGMVSTEQRISQHGGPHSGMASTEQRISQHGGPHSGMASTEQRISQHGGPHSGMVSTEQRISQHGGPHSGMVSTEQRMSQHGGPHSGMVSTEQRMSQHGGPHSGMVSTEQRISQHGGPHSGMVSTEQRMSQHGGPHSGMVSTEQRMSQHGGPHSGMVSTEQRMSQHGGPHSGMVSTEQRMSQHGGPHSGMVSTEQRMSQHGGPHSGMVSTEQRMSQHGGPHSGMVSTEQRISQHGVPQSGVPPPMTSTGQIVTQHGAPQSNMPPRMASIDQRTFQHGAPPSDIPFSIASIDHKTLTRGGPQSDMSSRMASTEQRTFHVAGPPLDIPPHIASTDQRTLTHGGPQSDMSSRMASTDHRMFHHDLPKSGISPHMAITEQRTFHHGGLQSGISPHMASTEQQVFQLGGPQSGNFKHGPLQPRSFNFGGPQHEGQLLNKLQHKDSGQDAFRVEDSQQQAQSFQNASQSGEPRISSFGGSLPEVFNPTSLNRPPLNEVFQYRVPPPSIIQQSSKQLPPGPAQNVQHPNNHVQSHYSFPPTLHRAPLNPPTIPSFVNPPMDAAFSGPPKESGREVSYIQAHAQHSQSVLDQEPFTLQRSENLNFHRPDNQLHQEMRHMGHTPDLITASEGTGVQNNAFFMKSSLQANDSNFFHQNVPDILRGQQFRHQQMFSEQPEKGLMNPSRQSEMLVRKEDPSDKDIFQQWLYNFLACHRNNFTPKPDSVQSVSIPEVRKLIYGALTLVSQLRSLCQCLENNKEEGPSWAQDYEKAKDIKGDLVKRIKELEKPGFIQCVKTKLDRIRKKRFRWQQRQAMEEDKEVTDRVAEREAEIDSWRMQCIQKVEEKKKERELKAAADSVLGEVRKKQADTKKMLDMLKSLEKLRKLRKEAAARKGVSPPPSADNTFKNHISRLRSMVHKRITLYDAEERALRVILEGEQEEERQREKDKRLRKQRERFLQKQRELDSILFGEDEPLPALHPLHPFRQYYLQAEHSVVSLVQIRHQWDRFLAPPDHPDASSIPRGWVLPMPPSSEIWATALKPAE